MEDRTERQPGIKSMHKVSMNQRREGSISGVTDVKSFDEKEIVLETQQGILTIKGAELHVSRLVVEKGELEISGRIDSLVYSDTGSVSKSGGSLLSRLFG